MKLGEALNQRKYLAIRIPQLRSKLTNSLMLQVGATPNPVDDKAVDLKAALDQALTEYNQLIVAINITNNSTLLENGLSIMQAIAKREYLKLAYEQYEGLPAAIRPRRERQGYSTDQVIVEFVVAPGINPVGIKSQVNQYAKELRELETLLQAANWTTNLLTSM